MNYVHYVPGKRKAIIVKKGTLRRNKKQPKVLREMMKEVKNNSYTKEDGTICIPNVKIIDEGEKD